MSLVLAWLVKNWRLLAYALAAAAALWMLVLVGHWRKDSTVRLPGAVAALEAEVACKVPSKCAERVAALQARQAVISETVVRGYEDELKSLRDRPVTVRTVRLCPDSRAGRVSGAKPAAGTDGASPSGGELHGSAQPDIGPDLYRLAADADEIAARLRALQQWNEALASKPAPR